MKGRHGSGPEGERIELTVGPDGEGERIDVYLAARLDLSRTRLQRLLARGEVRVGGEAVLKSHPVTPGERIEVHVPPPEPVEVEPESIDLEILFEDEALLVVNKPSGMVVHPAPGHRRGTLVNALLHHVEDLSGIGGRLRPGIVHRLDKDTSGLLVVAKRDDVHRDLSEQLRRRRIRRLYRAAAWGHLSEDRLRVEAPIGRDPSDRKRMAVRPGGRGAITKVRVRERWRAADYLDVALETGRTHQIRVHMLHEGHPLVGDPLYGAGWERGIGGEARPWAQELARRTPRLFLHAWALRFTHPLTRETVECTAPLPDDLRRVAEWAAATTEAA